VRVRASERGTGCNLANLRGAVVSTAASCSLAICRRSRLLCSDSTSLCFGEALPE
jgi:hypothetical protein